MKKKTDNFFCQQHSKILISGSACSTKETLFISFFLLVAMMDSCSLTHTVLLWPCRSSSSGPPEPYCHMTREARVLLNPQKGPSITDESRPENANNEQQQERLSHNVAELFVTKSLCIWTYSKMRHPKHIGSATQKTNLWNTERDKADVITRGKCRLHHPQSRLLTHQCFFLNLRNQQVHCITSPYFTGWEFKQTRQRGARRYLEVSKYS